MSKSLGNCIYLSDCEEDVRKKVMSMYTDPLHVQVSDPGHVEGNTVFTYLDAFCCPDHFSEFWPEYASLDGDVKIKKFLNSVLQCQLAPIRERRKELEKDIPYVYDVLRKGSEQAREVAARTLSEVKHAMRIDYFDDEELMRSQALKFKAE